MKHRRGLTLIEVLVAAAILAVFFAILIPAVQKVRETAARATSLNNLHQIGVAAHNYASDHDGIFPYDHSEGPRHRSLMGCLLPYLGEDGAAQVVKTFISPADPSLGSRGRDGLTSYAANAQVFRDEPRLARDFSDGTGNTMIFAERYALCDGSASYWYSPPLASIQMHQSYFAVHVYYPRRPGWTADLTFQVAPCPGPAESCGRREVCSWALAQTPHAGGMLALMADGSTHTLRAGMSAATYWAAVTPASGDALGSDW